MPEKFPCLIVFENKTLCNPPVHAAHTLKFCNNYHGRSHIHVVFNRHVYVKITWDVLPKNYMYQLGTICVQSLIK